MELKSRGYSVCIGKNRDKEIDFIAEKHDKKVYIQVAYLLASQSIIDGEYSVLEKIPDHHKKMVLSLDKYFKLDRSGIDHQNVIDFLGKGDI